MLTLSVQKQDGVPLSKFIVRNPCRTPASTCHRHHCIIFIFVIISRNIQHFAIQMSAPSLILVCALIYLPYLPVNLRHIFHQIPHIQLVPMCSNLHCCTTTFPTKYCRVFYRFLQNLLRIGSNALQ